MAKYRRIIAAITNGPLAIWDEKLDAICELLELRSRGGRFSPAEVAERVGPRTKSGAISTGGKIAVVPIIGTMLPRASEMEQSSGLTSTAAIANTLRSMHQDDSVSQIVLLVDSPGGAVAGVPELAELVAAIKKDKPVTAVVEYMAASAAWWVASQASEIVVSSSGQLGSQGVMAIHVDHTVANEKEGLKFTYIKSTPFKAEFSGDMPLSDAAMAYKQSQVDASHRMFIHAVAAGRGVSPEYASANFGQGRMLTASEAISVGMADRLGTLASVLDEMASGQTSGRPSHTPRKGLSVMHKELLTALVLLNACDVDATEENARAAAQMFLRLKGREAPATDELLVQALREFVGATNSIPLIAAQLVPQQPTVQAPSQQAGLQATDVAATIMATIRLANVTDPMALATRLSAAVSSGQMTLASAMSEIEQAASIEHRPAGATVAVTESRIDSFINVARDALVQHHVYRGQPHEGFTPTAGATQERRLLSVHGLSRAILTECGCEWKDVANLTAHDLSRIVLGNQPLRSFGIAASSDGTAYNASSMFANILIDASNVTLRRAYEEQNTSYQRWAKPGESLKDFKTVHRVIGGELPDPKSIPENGEFEEQSFTDGRESYALTVWGAMFSLTWQAYINDQLGEFLRTQQKQGSAMKRKHNRLVYGALTSNEALSDGVPLFHATHRNIGTTGAFTTTTLNEAYENMATQEGLSSDAAVKLGIVPRYVIYAPAIRQTVLEMLTSSTRNNQSNSLVKNVYEGALEPIEEAELNQTVGSFTRLSWFLACDAMQCDTVEYAFLEGLETPATDSRQAFDRLAFDYRIYQAFAVKPIDYRGLFVNLGA